MRTLAIVLGVVIVAVVVQQEVLFRTATTDALIGAYRSTALDQCAYKSDGLRSGNPGTGWATPRSIKLVIGDPGIDVFFWQVNHAMWRRRYQDPHLVILAERSQGVVLCEYDIKNNSAVVKGIG